MDKTNASQRIIGVAFPSYRIPEHRLRNHFAWNALLYRADSVHVFAVTDREYAVPEYAECVIFPERCLPMHDGRRRYSTTRCRNAGIRAAIDAGCEVIVCTDVDICFELEAWESLLAVRHGIAAVPYCRMAASSDPAKRESKWIFDEWATGTVAMVAEHWRKIQYSRNQWGYGDDDGAILDLMQKRGVQLTRDGHIYHIAHTDGANQLNFGGRSDYWNRDNGFNPDNFSRNRRQR